MPYRLDCAIQFAKFQQLASFINFKFTGKNCYYAFPVIDACWETEQNNLINTLKDIGDGRCDSTGYSAIYGLTQCWVIEVTRL